MSKTRLRAFIAGGRILYSISEPVDEGTLDIRLEPWHQRHPQEIKKALPKKDKSAAPAKKAPKANGAAEKKAGAGGKTRYTYPNEKAGAGGPQAAPPPAPVQPQAPIPAVPEEPQAPPTADPADLANQLGVSLHTLQRIAQRFVDNPKLGGQKGFIGFMQTKLKGMVDKHRLDGDYFSLIFQALTGTT